jgi:hypothetical protein
VAAAAPLLQTEQTNLGQTVTQQQIEHLPTAPQSVQSDPAGRRYLAAGDVRRVRQQRQPAHQRRSAAQPGLLLDGTTMTARRVQPDDHGLVRPHSVRLLGNLSRSGTYMLNGKQSLVLAISGPEFPAELIAYTVAR